LNGLARTIEEKGGQPYAGTAVQTVEEQGGGIIVRTNRGNIRGTAAVIATNSPIVDTFALHTKMAPCRTYAMAIQIPRDTLPDALCWDTLDPYHYVRVQPGDRQTDFVIIGGADHKSGEADDADVRFQALEAWARNLIPKLGEVSHRWSGQVLDTIDYAAFIGRNPGHERIYVHTGDSGQGMTHGSPAVC
jgi:glycine/D-amino acid oxidase-like deaminating enzyme